MMAQKMIGAILVACSTYFVSMHSEAIELQDHRSEAVKCRNALKKSL